MKCSSTIVGILVLMFCQVSSAAFARFHPCLNHGPSYFLSMDRSDRTIWAEELKSANRELDIQIPNLSPDDTRWFETEYHAGGQRAYLAENSIQGIKYFLKKDTKQREQILSALSQSAAMSLRKQIEYWAQLAESLNGYSFSRKVEAAVKNKIISQEFMTDDPRVSGEEELAFACRMQATHILKRIVIPYLKGEIEK